jgi:hypothetical protein
MKLIIKQYLASLREREELDAIVPALLSQLGLNVFSRPGRGTRQYGVDVAAVGSVDDSPEKVFLISIKSGDLTRKSWDETAQALRPSLNEIFDAYIPNCLPPEHKGKEIVICLCFGGDVQEPVRPLLKGYIDEHTKEKITFEEWNGDKLASLILSGFLREDLLPNDARPYLRKALALIDTPESSFRHFSTLILAMTDHNRIGKTNILTILRQINICLWILFSWGREENNVESAYLAGEFALLNSWEIAKKCFEEKSKNALAIQESYYSTLSLYHRICSHYLNKIVLPHATKRHALSFSVKSSSNIDINIRLYDVLGRLATSGLWLFWHLTISANINSEITQKNKIAICNYCNILMHLIRNNPVLLLPVKEDQAIDISIAILFLSSQCGNGEFICNWLSEMTKRADFSYNFKRQYPCHIYDYEDLLDHPRNDNESYFSQVTNASILFPLVALWAALLENDELYKSVSTIKELHLNHSNFQFWYPDESSEDHFYTNSDSHGATLSHINLDLPSINLIHQALGELEQSPHYYQLSAVKSGLWPLILVACRHHRIPVPLHMINDLREFKKNLDSAVCTNDDTTPILNEPGP